ncbi:Rz1-like lysis system protein LysC [Muribacter muris]|uniref:Rz1-like lysis system protein LysC n=1 Tax=Muribacter muris TaxID=67855 RepID=UPI0034DB7B62
MTFWPNWKNSKIGLSSLCLIALAACSNRGQVNISKPNPLICPSENHCRQPNLHHLNTNGDLIKALDQSLTTIELCQIQLQAYQQCIEIYNTTQSKQNQ